MSRTTVRSALLALAVATPLSALAQWRCDCTTIVDSCTAEVTARENWIDIRTDSRQCARVDYFVDGQPFVATVVEGQHRTDWMSPQTNPHVLVQSCQICADNASASRPTADPAPLDETDSGELEPLIRWSAAYPAQARLRGIEGHVVVGFDVTPEGEVDNAAVVESDPDGVFDEAALSAVRRWRYLADPARGATRLTERIEFSIGDMIWQLQPAAGAGERVAATAPRNQCIREEAVYNYGDMLEVGLINACADPLLVFGCAEGVGRQTGRWVCSDTERAGNLLLPRGDSRIGSTLQLGERAQNIEWLTLVDRFYVARAPNSQYWWVACSTGDTACREEARLWVRSLDRQPASLDPRGRAAITIARSR